MGDIFGVIAKIVAALGGLTLIVMVLVWFGMIPLTAFIFNASFTGWHFLATSAIMIGLIVLIVKLVSK